MAPVTAPCRRAGHALAVHGRAGGPRSPHKPSREHRQSTFAVAAPHGRANTIGSAVLTRRFAAAPHRTRHNGGMSKHAGKHEHASTPAVVALVDAGISHTLHPYTHDPASDLGYGLEAAAAIGVEPEQVFKTLCAYVDGHLSVGIVPVSGMLDLKALAHALGGKKAEMAPAADAERSSGYVVGGISPIGQRKALPTALDETAQLYDVIYVSGGRRGLDIGLAPVDLAAITHATVAAIAKES